MASDLFVSDASVGINTDRPVIEISKLEVRFRRIHALRGVELSVNPGSVFALLGENGAGKTTLIRVLTGFQKPSAGRVTLCGRTPWRDPDRLRRQVGYVSDAPSLYPWMSVAQIGGFAASLYSSEFLGRYVELIDRFEIDPRQKIKYLSKGQRAKVGLSLALAHNPALLIMDEPTSGLDPKVRKSFLESMIDRAAVGQTVFLSSHQISEVERVADQIAILHRGKIVLNESLDQVRSSVFHLVIDVDDPFRSLPPLSAKIKVLSEQTEGRQRRLIVRNFSEGMLEEIRSIDSVVQVQHRAATLEETFEAYTLTSKEPHRTTEVIG